MSFTLLVCGSKKFTDRKLLERSLNAVHRKRSIDTLITGSYSGAEEQSYWWAIQKPLPIVITVPYTGFNSTDYIHRYQRIFTQYKIDGVVVFGSAIGSGWFEQFVAEKGVTVWAVREPLL